MYVYKYFYLHIHKYIYTYIYMSKGFLLLRSHQAAAILFRWESSYAITSEQPQMSRSILPTRVFPFLIAGRNLMTAALGI